MIDDNISETSFSNFAFLHNNNSGERKEMLNFNSDCVSAAFIFGRNFECKTRVETLNCLPFLHDFHS